MLKDIRVSCAPHISQPLSTRSVMIDVIIGLVPAMVAAGYYFRIYAFTLIGVCVVSAVATECFGPAICLAESPGPENPLATLAPL